MFTNITNLLLILILLLALCRPSVTSPGPGDETEHEIEFTYKNDSGKGPGEWGKIHKNWTACQNGAMQSPIDILKSEIQNAPELGDLKRSYKKSPASIKNRGHDIMVKWNGDAGTFDVNGTVYNLKQCHWHSPSEHTFNGTSRQLEAHMVHETTDGKIAVVAITYIFGKPDPFLEMIIPHITEVGEKEKDIGRVDPKKINLGSKSYYRYIGSLTVPPCTEGVIWTVIKKPMTVSVEQVQELKEAVHDGFEVNARPVQHPKGRKVMLYT